MYWIYTLFPVVKLSYFPWGLNYILICDSGKWLFRMWLFQLQNCSHWIICKKAVVQAHLLTFIQTADEITTRFCSFIHFIWLTHNISFTRELFERMLICLLQGFPRNVFVHNSLVVSLTHVISSASGVDELYLVKSASASPFSQWKQDRMLNLKKDPVSQGSVSGIMPAYCALKWKWTFIEWLTSWTMSSLGHNEEIAGGADMVWKLCDKEECPKFKLLIELLFVLCERWPDSLENNKEFWMGKHKGFPQSFVLACAGWTKVTLTFGRVPRSTLKTVSGSCSGPQWSKCATDVWYAWFYVP